MKASFVLTTVGLICLLLTPAYATVVNIREVKSETKVVVRNESQQLMASEPPSGELLKGLETVGISNAIATNEREFGQLTLITTNSDCIAEKELEESKCEMQVRNISLFNENGNYLVCTVVSVFKCQNAAAGKPLDFNF
jgi:hypothetical protein